MRVFTIGFTKKTAEEFFGKLRRPGLGRLVDVRLNNTSQLAGFAKKDDLRYFVKAICGIEYVHVPELAPVQEILDEYKKRKGGWDAYEREFLVLIQSRRIEDSVPREVLDGACLLCSEDRPDQCHRRLVVEYLREKWGDLEIEHIV
jgi:uncharacterized protein (DUF488 family)